MTERKVEIDTTKNGSASEAIKPEETRSEKKARRAQVYDRGVMGDRLHVEYPHDKYHGEWVPDNLVDVNRKKSLGFWIDQEFAPKRALHDKGDGASYVGDVVFMLCSREDKEIIDEIRQDRYNKIHAPRGGKQKEEKDFVNLVKSEDGPIVESKVHVARKQDITDALAAVERKP